MSKAVELLREIRDLLSMQASPLLDKRGVVKFLCMGKTSIERAEAEGRFPKAVATPGGPRWRREELIQWVKTLKPRRRKPRGRRRIVLPVESTDASRT
ncbi:hypothetical protein PX52LOC_04718 [Limnoglobus roseus]|uniref:AlpA family phage regulatory protein n=1 Tax=Limnoglobus roseus TaxID=2598579 RepID=A0A5C1AEB0_9BACT|nr:hypothetical protein PX52LOC_04718 [Limnoglobus roseus]